MSVYSMRQSGLIVAEQAADFQSVERALKDFDPDLVLNVEVQDGLPRYEVHKVISGDRPAIPVCVWMDAEGTPLPLSSGLIDLVKELHPDSRRFRGGLDPEQYAEKQNERLRQSRRKDFEDTLDEIAADMGPRIDGRRSPAFHRGIHLRKARSGGVS